MAHLPDFDAERTRLFIPHYELALDDLPAQGSSWSDTVMLVESFDGSVVYPAHAAMERFASGAREVFEFNGDLPQSLTMLRTALSVERRFPHFDGPREDPERMRYAHALVESIRSRISSEQHISPSSTPGGVQDRVMNAYDRLLAEYASWGGWRYYGWGGYEDRATYLGPAVWSERDCDLRLAYELEREFPKAVHMEFPIAKWTRHDFAPPEVVQRVDVVVSDFSGFVDGDEASLVFKEHRHQAFFEVKWCARRAGPGTVASLGPDAYPSLRTCASSPTTSSLDAA